MQLIIPQFPLRLLARLPHGFGPSSPSERFGARTLDNESREDVQVYRQCG